jgi:hypothetical protein
VQFGWQWGSFAVPTSKFCAYQTGKAAPWWFKRWVLFQKDAKLEPLYDMDKTLENSTAWGNWEDLWVTSYDFRLSL